ncbi:MAG: cytochrome c biogenesis protein CcsA, partial [Polyangiaceae bacterium]|nr:cytochrome c biogenesis protein CcsA [Polyangiaceae bacterium]
RRRASGLLPGACPFAMMFADILFGITGACYAIATVMFVRYLFGEEIDKKPKWAPRLVTVGAVLHAIHIVVSSLVTHTCPVEGMHFALSVVSMLACAAYAVLRFRYPVDLVGTFVAPFALTFLFASRVVGMKDEPAKIGSILPLHITANLLGDALFTLAFGAAVLYLLQENRLKKKAFAGLSQKLPPLDSLDRAEHRFLLYGFPLLTIGILTGTVFSRRVEFGSVADQTRAAFGYLTWIVFAAVLSLRAAAGWRGRKAAYGTITGFAIALLVLALYLWRSIQGAA